ncbi:MAG: transposase family protein [Lachnospiraceae bacterium]|nr:transposase family protein [Lachnospiraceae bacterium]
MSNVIFATGMILKDAAACKRYRIISMFDCNIVLCEMDIKKLSILTFEKSVILNLFNNGQIEIEPEKVMVFDADTLSSSQRSNYENKLHIMHDVVNAYAPTFEGLTGHKAKPILKEIMSRYTIPSNTFWRVLIKYLQSGMKEISLVDSKVFGLNKGKKYQYAQKPGKTSQYIENSGVVRDEDVIHNFDEALKEYKSGRQKSFRKAFDYMNNLHYTRVELVNGVHSLVLLPESERPTFNQFYYYAYTHLTQKEKDIIKTSAQEHRNDKRLITSDSLSGVYGPGDMVEIDACEADVSLVSITGNGNTVGRPIVYFMIDVYTRVILAASVAFDNNSILGVTNLFLNLADDKKDYCTRYGIGFEDDRLWPSNIIPRRIRVDRGSEFRSKEFTRICVELGIEKQLVSGASGSLKGTVEQSFHQMEAEQNTHLEDKGLIEKRYDSNHHKEATLDIFQYTKMVINFVLTHNQKYNENYPLTKEMLEKGIQPIPAILWQYGIQTYSSPKTVSMREQFIYNLMTPVKAKLSRRGISYKGLWYLAEDDSDLKTEMFRAGTKKVNFNVRMDMRCVGAVYYLRDGKLIKATLNPKLNGNADYANLTMKEWSDYQRLKKEMDAKGRVHNEQLSAYSYAVNAGIVDEAKRENFSSDRNIRQNRAEEKQAISSQGRMQGYLDRKEEKQLALAERSKTVEEEIAEKIEKGVTNEPKTDKQVSTSQPSRKEYSSFEEAFKDF